MAARAWRYSQFGQSKGPVSTDELRSLIAAGQVPVTEMAWTEGMADWAPINSLPELMQAQPAGLTPAAAIPVAPVAYYAPTGSMPQRAVETLRRHARPTGDVGDWPLDDARVAQFQQAMKLRKRVTAAAQLYRGLLFLSIIGAVIFLLAALFMLGGAGGKSSQAAAIGMLAGLAATVAVCVLYYFAARATSRSHRWAPLTLFIIFLFFIATNLLTVVIGAGAGQPAAAVGPIIVIVLMAAFTVTSWRAFAAIPEYLKQPAWCQELIARAEL